MSAGNIAGRGCVKTVRLPGCVFSKTLEMLGAEDSRVCAVVNDSLSSTKLKDFKAKFPERFVNVGIAEQNMVGVGSGLANGGMVPYVCGASCFLTARAMEQVKVDMAYSNSNVKLCGMSSGMAYGQLGATHHSIEDLAWTRILPNLAVIVPADPEETAQAMRYSLEHVGPMFLRISRMPVRAVQPEGYQFTLGKAALLRDGNDVTLVANGGYGFAGIGCRGCAGGEGNFGARSQYELYDAAGLGFNTRCSTKDSGHRDRGGGAGGRRVGRGGGRGVGCASSRAHADSGCAGCVCAYGYG